MVCLETSTLNYILLGVLVHQNLLSIWMTLMPTNFLLRLFQSGTNSLLPLETCVCMPDEYLVVELKGYIEIMRCSSRAYHALGQINVGLAILSGTETR